MNTTASKVILCELADPGLSNISSYSPFCEKIHRSLRYAQIPYERNNGAYPAVFKNHHPTGRVPVLLVDEKPIVDSTAILEWIVQSKPELFKLHQDPKLQAEAWLWEEFADTTLSGYLVAARWADSDNWPRTKQALFGAIPRLIRSFLAEKTKKGVLLSLKNREIWDNRNNCWERFGKILDHLEQKAPTQGFWLGEQITAADLGIFPPLQSLLTPITPKQQSEVESRKTLRSYLERVDQATKNS